MVKSHGAAPITREPYAGVKETAHQRDIAEAARKISGRQRLMSLAGAYVKMITEEEAESIILKFEWLGDIGNATKFVGLFTPTQELIGVACFGSGPADKAKNKRTKDCAGEHIAHTSDKTMLTLLGGPCMCLERGACVPHAPMNAASFLISHACRLIYRETGIDRFFAYGDPEAGEYGAVYQAANWIYLGQGLMGDKFRAWRDKVCEPGKDPSNPRNWKTTRVLRRPGKPRLSYAGARKLGYLIEKFPAKHVYAINVGREVKKWRRQFPNKSYPKPRLESEARRS